jgi:predicted ATPase
MTLEDLQSPIMNFEFEPENGELLDVTIPSLQPNPIIKYKSLISKIFDFKSDKSIFDIMGNYSFVSNDPLFPELLNRFVNIFFNEFRESFSELTFNYMGPLREYPQKYYIGASNYCDLSVLSNYKIAELLANNQSLLEKVNQWLAYFATRVGIDETQEDVRRIKAIRNELDYDLDISNVGFGISQILPVIVQALLSPPYSVTIVEQPEVHLHPNMQAKLADLFIDTIYNIHNQRDSKRKFLIETHSVAFLNRLRLRIAQKKIQKSDIAIYALSINSKNDGIIDQISILDGGDFDWPEDFIEEELMDSIELAKIISGATQ